MVEKIIHLYEDAELSSSVFACCVCHYQIPHSWYLLQSFLQFSPVHQTGWICWKGTSSAGVTNCQCSSRRRKYKAEDIYLLEWRSRSIYLSLIIYWGWICSASKNLSIRRSRSSNLSNHPLGLDMFRQPESMSVRKVDVSTCLREQCCSTSVEVYVSTCSRKAREQCCLTSVEVSSERISVATLRDGLPRFLQKQWISE